MTIRTTSKTITFNRPFCLKGVDRWLPPGDYRVVTDEELIEGLSFPAYHRISTVIFVPAQSGPIEMVTIEPVELQAAQEQDGSEHCAPGLIASFSSTSPLAVQYQFQCQKSRVGSNEEQGDASRAAH